MYVDICKTRQGKKVYRRYLLRESYREGGKVNHRTIANLSRCKPEEIEAIRLALRHKGDLSALGAAGEHSVRLSQGRSVGAVWTLGVLAERTGVARALGRGRQGRLALWQVVARTLDQGSRLSAVRLAQRHAACEVLQLDEGFCEDNLYGNLAWLAEQQSVIEERLFRARCWGGEPRLFLYDVTSSYLEGDQNELGDWGYDRDKKRGKKQIVIGLLCDGEGAPVSVEVFRGNTQDLSTFASQVKKVAGRLGCKGVTFVGDRGMIKSAQIEQLRDSSFHFISALTKPQVETLLARGLLQMDMFDETVCEVQVAEGLRCILRRNPVRAEEIAATRRDKQSSVQRLLRKKNQYLQEHPRARVEVARRDVAEKIARLRIGAWLGVQARGRLLHLVADEVALAEASRLDGCYVIKTDLAPSAADAQTVHDRYKDLAEVEQAFRTMKTAHLEVRPVYVRREPSTRGHVFVTMLAYLLRRELARLWAALDITVEEGLEELAALCATEMKTSNGAACQLIPMPRPLSRQLLRAARVTLPKVLPKSKAVVATRRKLPIRRTKH